jgi:hypothetical protein
MFSGFNVEQKKASGMQFIQLQKPEAFEIKLFY